MLFQFFKNIDFHLLDTGHFALEEDGDLIAGLIRDFIDKNVVTSKTVWSRGSHETGISERVHAQNGGPPGT